MREMPILWMVCTTAMHITNCSNRIMQDHLFFSYMYLYHLAQNQLPGVMQESYFQGVLACKPKKTPALEEVTSLHKEDRRLVLVFCRGRYQEFQTASGAPCTVADFALKPPPKPITFGMAPGLGIGETYL
jgi:hypothetical protein